MTPSCVNGGGSQSLVRLEQVAQLDLETPLTDQAVAALSRWQARSGEVVTVVDGESTTYRARIVSLDPGRAACVPFQKLPLPAESPVAIHVYQSLPEKERFELVLQKLTEIGVFRIVPIETEHSTTVVARDAVQKKSHRWPDVILRAARQCRRAMLPELLEPRSFTQALVDAGDAELKLMLYEQEANWTITEGFGSLEPGSVALLVGPEGGFSVTEVDQARAAGFLPVSLGPRVLRTETAAIVAAALVQSRFGDLG